MLQKRARSRVKLLEEEKRGGGGGGKEKRRNDTSTSTSCFFNLSLSGGEILNGINYAT